MQRNRLIGLREAFTAAGVAWDRIPVVERFEHSVAAGASAAAEVLALDPGITALVATSDVLALGAIEELTRRRQRVPEDVSVTGFDGIRGAIDAKLTTVVQPVVEKGRQAGRMLLNPARKTQGRRVVLPTTFLLGRDHGAAAPDLTLFGGCEPVQAGQAADPLADQHHADDQDQHAHHCGVVGLQPGLAAGPTARASSPRPPDSR